WILAIVIVWIVGQSTYYGVTQSMLANGAVIDDACKVGSGPPFHLAIYGLIYSGLYLAVGMFAGIGIGIILVRFMYWCPSQVGKPVIVLVKLLAIMLLNAISTFIGSGILAGLLAAHYLPLCLHDLVIHGMTYRNSFTPNIFWGILLLGSNLVLPFWARAIAIRR
ncbi:MAG: hypothetical protein AAGG53_11850, partial [Cyanobacteria bacterium P01_H01_bin.152]